MKIKVYNRTIKYTEVILVAFVWLVLIITPILFREDYYNPLWKSVANQLEILFPLLGLFILNRFIFVPRLLFRGKLTFFISAVFGTILILTLGSYFYETNIRKSAPSEFMLSQEELDRMPTPDTYAGRVERYGNPRLPKPRQPRPMPPFANFLILSVLIVGFDTGLRSGLRWIGTENEKVRLEKENVANQLMFLRNQVSPHFFMNTLNNIHALIDINTEEAKEAIIKLSKMMRYLLYETQTGSTTVSKEVEFLVSYVDLMRLRFSDKVRVNLNIPASIPEKTIAPLIFTSLIENAFKHGISYKEGSFIDIDLIFGEERLLLMVKNSKTEKNMIDEFSGIGIENTRKRLDLLYGTDYTLDIINSSEVFTVNLSIPL